MTRLRRAEFGVTTLIWVVALLVGGLIRLQHKEIG
jgi:hypothetical protein